MINNVLESNEKYGTITLTLNTLLEHYKVLKWATDVYNMLIYQFNIYWSINRQISIHVYESNTPVSKIKLTLIQNKNDQYRCVDRYLNLESFCRMMLSFSSSLLSWLGALSTMAIVLNQVSVLHVSRNGCWNGESVDIWRNISIADPMKVCQWKK